LKELGVNQVAARIHARLQRYLEAQYHIRDTGIIEERRALLLEPGAISQRPFVEVTPSYAVSGCFDGLAVPPLIRALLTELSELKPGIGVFPPYKHQADALEGFFRGGHDGDDLIVATGTGSGKTETFLYAVMGHLALEAAERRNSFKQDGVRALLLYPMNALVSDQTARLRRMFGDERFAALFRHRWGRHPRFGMYTSRTPYPGVRTDAKDTRNIEPLLSYYEQKELSTTDDDQRLVAELKQRGRWPAKDVQAFFASGAAIQQVIRNGARAGQARTQRNWRRRLVTQEVDRELLTRHEMQAHAPDLLVTNYSMLEYMLLRPIERSIFSQTRAWLDADPRNQLLLVLDEAHMYRGVAGAEVGLLIRRLQSRLGIKRDRLRCILTSASLGAGDRAKAAGQVFADALTGSRAGRAFTIVTGTPEARDGAEVGTVAQAAALAQVDAAALAGARIDPQSAHAVVAALAQDLGWPKPPPSDGVGDAVRQYVGQQLTGFGPLELLIKECAGNGKPFEQLAETIFPRCEPVVRERATDGLLALGCFSRRSEPGRTEQPLLPTRAHMMFRGLPPVYACVNPACSARRHEPGSALLIGRLYNQPRTHCACGARVFELYTHRDCGAAFLRAFAEGRDGTFLWHERGGQLTEFGKPLHEIHFFIEQPHDRAKNDRALLEPVVVDIATGRLAQSTPTSIAGHGVWYRPAAAQTDQGEVLSTFDRCPACLRATGVGRSLKIMDLATKGEQPFANVVREQFVCQLPTKKQDDDHPNEGKKALLFSDGRQKAARLARDLPREVERDSFREALVLAIQNLRELGENVQLDRTLYAAFVAVCAKHHLHFFDRKDQEKLLEEIRRFRLDHGASLADALEFEWRPTPPDRYRRALLRQICDPYYSLTAACAAVVEPHPVKMKAFLNRVAAYTPATVATAVCAAWIREMLGKQALDHELTSLDVRRDEFRFFEPIKSDGLKRFFDDVSGRVGLDKPAVPPVRDALFEVFTQDVGEAGRLLMGELLRVRLALDETWVQCRACGEVQLPSELAACVNCWDKRLEPRPPEHPYMQTRKAFFREPLRAVLQGGRPIHITAEEHTAQLSQRDAGIVYATTEEFELRFQDVALGPTKPPVDILSCTTTMEVGIDIGALTAVGLRTVPPQRENYQQRAGRAGRRGTSVSTVLTFAQGGAHDAHYFANPHAIISGPPREPRVKIDNPRLARRHINSFLLQTFFHAQLDALSNAEQQALAEERSNLMSAFGPVQEFFDNTGTFTFAAFERWITDTVLAPRSAVIEEIVGWLPDQLVVGADAAKRKRALVRGVASDLLAGLRTLAPSATTPNDEQDAAAQVVDEDETAPSLIDLLFDAGLLPSYAFPTDLCSFVIQGWADNRLRVTERPQLGKGQALSEYAPGRLLVVNKQTYRVGGVFVEGCPTAMPGRELFSTALKRYVGCAKCTYVRIEDSPVEPTDDESPCPVCKSPLQARDLLDPPAFSPEAGRAVREGDREQDITYASSAQLPELVEGAQYVFEEGAGAKVRHAYAEEVVLIVANKGRNGDGFVVCGECGAAWLEGQEPPTGNHERPFLVPAHVLAREGVQRRCSGVLRHQILLGHQFRSDILLLRFSLAHPFDYSPAQPWLYDALATLSEAVALGASLHLDIDPGELSAGFRLLPVEAGSEPAAEIFLYDTAAGGAGYAADAGQDLQRVFDRTEELLRECPGGCATSCTQCLRHYGNRFLHPRLDRRLGLQLLRYARYAESPAVPAVAEQQKCLVPLARFLELEGWTVRTGQELGGVVAPLVAKPPGDGARVVAVGVYPCLLRADEAERSHPVAAIGTATHVLVPDYLVERDLPNAHRLVAGPVAALPGVSPSAPLREVPRRELDDLVAGRRSRSRKSVQLRVQATANLSAVSMPDTALGAAGVSGGSWVIVRDPVPEDFVEGANAPVRAIVARTSGTFKATGERWTVANVVRQEAAANSVGKISYGSATGERFRPERVPWDDLRVLGIVIEIVEAC
jgi:ATP-dependent helicase YprA (DUF1998 family)